MPRRDRLHDAAFDDLIREFPWRPVGDGTTAFRWQLAGDGDDLRQLLGCERWRTTRPTLVVQNLAEKRREVTIVDALAFGGCKPLFGRCPASTPASRTLPVNAQQPCLLRVAHPVR